MNKTTNFENIESSSKNIINKLKKKNNMLKKESKIPNMFKKESIKKSNSLKKLSKKLNKFKKESIQFKKESKEFKKKNIPVLTKSINTFNNIENILNNNENNNIINNKNIVNKNKNKSLNSTRKIVYNNDNKQAFQLEILFDLVLNKFEQLTKKYLNIDGKALWQPIKNILSKYDDPHFHALKYKTLSDNLVDKIMSITEYIRNGAGEETLLTQNHFIIQQVRIPLKEEPSIKKIVQIALNIGQWKGNPDKKIYSLLNYKKTGLDKINKYLNNYNIKKLSSYIDDNTVIAIKEYLDSL